LFKREKINKYKSGKEEKAKYDKVLSKYIKEQKAHHDAAKKGKEEEVKPKEVKEAQPKSKVAATKAADPKKAAAPIKQAQ